MSPETKKQPKPRELTFEVAEDLDADDPEFLSDFIELLKSKGYDPDQFVFSGFDAKSLVEGQPLERKPGIFAMNLAGWKSTFESDIVQNNPAHYAERYMLEGVPAIGLYDKNQLAEAYSHAPLDVPDTMELSEEAGHKILFGGQQVGGWDIEKEDAPVDFKESTYEELMDERAEFKNVDLGEPLATLPYDSPVTEGVVHMNYPNGSPIDEMVGVVFIKKVSPKHPRQKGL